MKFTILTLFPEAIEPYLGASILGRAQAQKLMQTQLVNIRDFATDKHKTVDDTPYGGGAGMVLKIEPIARAIDSINDQFSIFPVSGGTPQRRGNFQSNTNDSMTKKRRIIVLSARGKQFTQAKAAEFARLDELVLICGRYEGIDQRVADHLADEELSIGPYVLAGGEIAALAVVEATARLIPGVLGNEESLLEESYSSRNSNIKAPNSKQIRISKIPISNIVSDFVSPREAERSGDIRASDLPREYPHYTKPADYKGWKVPEVLLSGNHEEIRRWREGQQKNT